MAITRVGAVLAVLLVVSACRASAPPAAPATGQAGSVGVSTGAASPADTSEVQRLIAAAKANGETELNISWGAPTLLGVPGEEGAKAYEAAFNRMHGTNIRINFTPGPSFQDMAGKIAQELASGRKASSDVFAATEAEYAPWLDQDVLERYDYTKLNPTRMPREVVATHNLGVEAYTTIPGILYNTNLIPPAEAPRKLMDTLDPKWKGKIASVPSATYLDAVALHPDWGVERMLRFVAALSPNLAGLIRATETPRIASGEFPMMVMNASHTTERLKAGGAPVGFVLPEDGAVVRFIYLSVPRNSEHPNLAKLFINTAMSEEGQRITFERTFTDHYALPGSRSSADVDALKARGIKVAEIDVDVVAQRPELKAGIDEMVRLLRGG
jgi:iron(III) transport system substrate-binding protein